MAYHPRYKHSLEELFLHVYVYIDDWLEPYRPQLPKHSVLAKAAPERGLAASKKPVSANC